MGMVQPYSGTTSVLNTKHSAWHCWCPGCCWWRHAQPVRPTALWTTETSLPEYPCCSANLHSKTPWGLVSGLSCLRRYLRTAELVLTSCVAMMPAPQWCSNIALSLWQCGPECREKSNHLLVTEPLDSAKGGTTPDSCSLCVNSGDVAALGRPLHKALCPEASLVYLQKQDHLVLVSLPSNDFGSVVIFWKM